MIAKKTATPTPARRLRWLGGPEPERYIPGVPARDLEEGDLDRLDWLRSRGDAAPDAAGLIASGLYGESTSVEDQGADIPRGNSKEPVTPEVPASPADAPATDSEEMA